MCVCVCVKERDATHSFTQSLIALSSFLPVVFSHCFNPSLSLSIYIAENPLLKCVSDADVRLGCRCGYVWEAHRCPLFRVVE